MPDCGDFCGYPTSKPCVFVGDSEQGGSALLAVCAFPVFAVARFQSVRGTNMGCVELLSKDAQKRARRGEAQPGAVIRDRFQELHQEGRKLIQGWAERAATQFDCAERDSFEPFI